MSDGKLRRAVEMPWISSQFVRKYRVKVTVCQLINATASQNKEKPLLFPKCWIVKGLTCSSEQSRQ